MKTTIKQFYTINADDYGRDEITTQAILTCFKRGWIDTCTLMVNTSNSEVAASQGIAVGYIDRIGLHINIMEGKPLTKEICNEPSFCTNGVFNKRFMRLHRCALYLTKREKVALTAEIKAQMTRYISFGLQPKYLDSHCSTHNLLPVLQVIMPCMREFGFKTIRIARNINANTLPLHSVYKRFINRLIKSSGVQQSDYFTSFRDLMAQPDVSKYRGKIELMTHPYETNGCIENIGSSNFEEFFAFINSKGSVR